MRTGSYVYLLANKHDNVLYTGVTKDWIRRVYEYKTYIPRHEFSKNRIKMRRCARYLKKHLENLLSGMD